MTAGASTLASADVVGAATVGGTLDVTGTSTLADVFNAAATSVTTLTTSGAADVGEI